MSDTDISYHRPAQMQNALWTALVLNPHQKKDKTTTEGMRAFQLAQNPKTGEVGYDVVNLPLVITNTKTTGGEQ